jgi:hypothetical protein
VSAAPKQKFCLFAGRAVQFQVPQLCRIAPLVEDGFGARFQAKFAHINQPKAEIDKVNIAGKEKSAGVARQCTGNRHSGLVKIMKPSSMPPTHRIISMAAK